MSVIQPGSSADLSQTQLTLAGLVQWLQSAGRWVEGHSWDYRADSQMLHVATRPPAILALRWRRGSKREKRSGQGLLRPGLRTAHCYCHPILLAKASPKPSPASRSGKRDGSLEFVKIWIRGGCRMGRFLQLIYFGGTQPLGMNLYHILIIEMEIYLRP